MKEFVAPHPAIPALIARLDSILHDEDLPEGLMQSDVLIADTLHHAHVHLYLLSEQKGGIIHVTDEDVDNAAKFFKEILQAELDERKGRIETETH